MRSSFVLSLLLGLTLVSCVEQKPQTSTEPKKSADSSAQPVPPPVAQPAEPVHKYGVRSGIVVYDNSLTNGQEKLYFDDYGAHEAYYSAPAKSGASARIVTLYFDGWRYQYDVDNKIGEKRQMSMPTGPIVGAIPDVWNKPKEAWSAFNVHELEPRTFLGHEAKGYSFDYNGSNKVWLWEGIPMFLQMKTEGGSGDVPTLKAASVRTDVELPYYAFVIPNDVRLTERKPTPAH